MTNEILETRVSALEVQMNAVQDTLQQLASLQVQTQQQLSTLTASISRLEKSQERTDQQFQSFIREWSRIHANDSDRLARYDAAIDSNRESVSRLTNTL